MNLSGNGNRATLGTGTGETHYAKVGMGTRATPHPYTGTWEQKQDHLLTLKIRTWTKVQSNIGPIPESS